jgi:2,4-dienoyl-CoA reductase-like NADH-dependent reductase (Old Yellow Enzyme family)
MPSTLFTPFRLGNLELPNRVVVSPMCQYSAEEGSATDWHMIHLGSMALSGAGLVFVEATAVEPEGRITPGCLGLWSEANEVALGRVIAAMRRYGRSPIGIQLAHAGRKAASKVPWQSNFMNEPDGERAWPVRGPSPLAFSDRHLTPRELATDELAALVSRFAAATKRAQRLGLDLVEVHGAHGYLLHQFLSPISNRRSDRYGGSLENRMRFPLEVFDAVRAAWPQEKPVGVRVSATDWLPDGGWDLAQTIELCRALAARGCAYIDVSSGGNSLDAKIPVGPCYQVPLAAEIRKAVAIPVMAVGMITEPEEAEAIVARGDADLVALARAFLDDPRWPWHAAVRLGAKHAYPPQYERATQDLWPPAKRLHGKATAG